MALATYKRGEIRTAVYTNGTGAEIPVNTIIVGGVVATKKSHVCVARETIAIGGTGIVAVSGVFEFPKATAAVIKMGESVNWDASASNLDDNAAIAATGDVAQFGVALDDAGSGVLVLDVDISEPGIYTA